MTEFDSHNNEMLRNMELAVTKAAEIIGGTGANPLDVFPNPASEERREDIVWGGELTEDQQSALRGLVAEFGPGRETNIGPDEAGLENGTYTALLEGGQPHKMIAELNIVMNTSNRPGTIIIAGAEDRKLGDGEREIGNQLLGADVRAQTEMDMADAVIRSHPEFVPMETEEADRVYGEYTWRQLGMLGSIPVMKMGIVRIPTGEKTYFQLSNFDKMALAANLTGQDVALVASATYEPSHRVAAAQINDIRPDREFTVLTYGTHELAAVKGTEPQQPSIAQLGAEAYKAAKLLK